MADLVNNRVNEAQGLLQARAKRLENLVKKAQSKQVSGKFQEGVRILTEMIEGQTKMIDTLVFDTPKTSLEQMRNLQLTTGGMNKTPTEHLKPTTDAMDMMLEQLEGMVR